MEKDTLEKNVITFTTSNNPKKLWCRIAVYKSIVSNGSIEQDFSSEWQSLVTGPFKITEPSQVAQLPAGNDDWKAKTGGGKFIFNNSMAKILLVTYSGYTRCISIVAVTNSEDYLPAIQKFLDSFKLRQTDAGPQPVNSTNVNNSVITGTWRRGSSVTLPGGSFGRWSSTGYQYIFNTDGTYSYTIKVYVEDDKETLLTRETGRYSISGNNVTLIPKTNVIEAWSKKNGGDNYNKLISSQKKVLEKTTYRFEIHFFEELRESGLVLIADTETVRDGKYNGSYAYPNGWRFSPSGPNYKPIKLPGE